MEIEPIGRTGCIVACEISHIGVERGGEWIGQIGRSLSTGSGCSGSLSLSLSEKFAYISFGACPLPGHSCSRHLPNRKLLLRCELNESTA